MYENILSLENISFSYGKTKVLENISFDIEKNQIVSLLGANGSGKSTLLKIILGFLKYEGEIKINGMSQKKLFKKELASKISYVPQSVYIPFDFTVLEVVLMGRYHKTSFWIPYSKHDKAQAFNALEAVDARQFKDRLFKTLSGGEKQLILLARAIAQESEIIIMDEPVTGLDLGNQVKLLENIKNLSKNSHTIFQTTHYPDHALKVSDFVVWIHESKIMSKGLPKKVITPENIEKIYKVKSEIINASNKEEYLITL